MPELPSSHGSLDADGGVDGAEGEQPVVDDVTSGGGDDGFDSGEFREWMRTRYRQRRAEADRPRRGSRRSGRDGESDEDQSSNDWSKGAGSEPPPPEWNGENPIASRTG